MHLINKLHYIETDTHIQDKAFIETKRYTNKHSRKTSMHSCFMNDVHK